MKNRILLALLIGVPLGIGAQDCHSCVAEIKRVALDFVPNYIQPPDTFVVARPPMLSEQAASFIAQSLTDSVQFQQIEEYVFLVYLKLGQEHLEQKNYICDVMSLKSPFTDAIRHKLGIRGESVKASEGDGFFISYPILSDLDLFKWVQNHLAFFKSTTLLRHELTKMERSGNW
jgi:hypothetical protein